MGLKNVFQFSPLCFQLFKVWACLPEWVDDGGFPFAFDVISSLGEATGINLFNNHFDMFIIDEYVIMNA
jgi:hypothetical protein